MEAMLQRQAVGSSASASTPGSGDPDGPRAGIRGNILQQGGGALVVAALLVLTIAVAVYAKWFNQRTVDVTPWLAAHGYSDSNDKGNSTSRWTRTDTSWRFHYRLVEGFPFPYAGGGLHFDPATPRELRDFGRFERIRFGFRHEHRGAPLLRLFVMAGRVRDGRPLVAPNEGQFRPTREWNDIVLDHSILRLPSWWIAQNGIETSDQKVSLADVRSLEFASPDVLSTGDSGVMEVGRVRLEGERIPVDALYLLVQILWVGAGLLYLVVGWWSWKGRARQAARRADQAEEAARLRRDFFATMSHEIRTPLNGVIVPAQMLQATELDPRQSEHVLTILESGNHLAAILQDALDWSKIEVGRLELEHLPFSVKRAVEAARRVFEPKAREKGIGLDVFLDPDLPEAILGDPLRLRQVLMNLVSNAIKFTELGGIRIEARRVRSTDAGSSDLIRFAVVDSGIGMDPEAGRKLFQRFTQLESSTSRKFGGTGLGLAIAQGIVQMMGGRIEFESEPGKGSTFHFSIPFVEVDSQAEAETGTMPVFESEGMDVLVVDDNRVNRKVALSILEKLGCRVQTAEDGQEALSVLERKSFDLVLMDCHMPGMDGFDATRVIRSWMDDAPGHRRRAAGTPVVALTADVHPDVRERCLAAGMDGVIAKPFSQERLAAEIARWAGARGRNAS